MSLEKKINKKIQDAYVNFVLEGRSEDLNDISLIYEISKIRDLSEENIQTYYCTKITDKKFQSFKLLKQITGIEPLNDNIQIAYKTYLENRDLTNLEELHNATGIPLLEELVQWGYNRIISPHTISYPNYPDAHLINWLKNITGIELSDEFIQKAYSTFIQNDDMQSADMLHEITKIQPKVAEDIVQEAYRFMKIYHCDERIEFLRKLTGIEPL